MDIEAYLQSEEAERDVATQIERYRTGTDDPPHDRWCAGPLTVVSPWHKAFCTEPDVTYPHYECVRVYYRPEGESYIVTDMGEAVRARRFRTGDMCHPSRLARVPWHIGDVLACLDPFTFSWQDDALQVSAAAAALPSAICRMMLAAYRVARL